MSTATLSCRTVPVAATMFSTMRLNSYCTVELSVFSPSVSRWLWLRCSLSTALVSGSTTWRVRSTFSKSSSALTRTSAVPGPSTLSSVLWALRPR